MEACDSVQPHCTALLPIWEQNGHYWDYSLAGREISDIPNYCAFRQMNFGLSEKAAWRQVEPQTTINRKQSWLNITASPQTVIGRVDPSICSDVAREEITLSLDTVP